MVSDSVAAFKDLKFSPLPAPQLGRGAIHWFINGYGVSVIQSAATQGKYEIMMMKASDTEGKWEICKADGDLLVKRVLTENEISGIMRDIDSMKKGEL